MSEVIAAGRITGEFRAPHNGFQQASASIHNDEVASKLGFKGAVKAKDLWFEKDLGTISSPYAVTVPGHGVLLLRVSK